MISLHMPGLTHEQQALAHDIRQEISPLPYQRQIWPSGQVAQLAQMPYVDFQTLLAERCTPRNDDQAAWEEDLVVAEGTQIGKQKGNK